MITIRLAGTPKGKGRPRFSRKSGAAFTPAPTRNYEAALRMAGQQEMGARPLLGGPLCVHVVALMPIAASWPKKKQAAAVEGALRPTGKPDIDNIAKMLDALNQVVWADDAQIVRAVIEKRYSTIPSLTVHVEAMP